MLERRRIAAVSSCPSRRKLRKRKLIGGGVAAGIGIAVIDQFLKCSSYLLPAVWNLCGIEG